VNFQPDLRKILSNKQTVLLQKVRDFAHNPNNNKYRNLRLKIPNTSRFNYYPEKYAKGNN